MYPRSEVFDAPVVPSGADAVEALSRARHDLGKYVACASRCLPDDASESDLRDALRADLCSTRSSPPSNCGEVWAGLRPDLIATGVSLAAIDAAVALLVSRAEALDQLARAELLDTVVRAVALGDVLRAMHRAALAQVDSEASA
jgi:hypothetical protein